MVKKLLRLVLGPTVVHLRDRAVVDELRSALEVTGQDVQVRVDQ